MGTSCEAMVLDGMKYVYILLQIKGNRGLLGTI